MTTVPATQKKGTIAAYLQDPYIVKQIERAVPKHMTSDRLLRVFLTCIQGNKRLLECSPKSLLGCLMVSAQLGLEPSPVTGQAAIVPYKGEAQFQPMYRGLLALVRRSGELQSVQAQVVYTNDVFILQYGIEDKLEHTPADGERGEVKGAYCIFKYKDGGYSFDYMSRHDIEKIRKRSKAMNDGPWKTDYDEMAKKTVIKRHCKLAPVSIEVQTATALDDRIQMGASQMDLLEEGEDPIDIQVETECGEEYEQEQTFPIFDKLVSTIPDGEQSAFLKFTAATALANGCPVEDVKASITDETAADFVEQFELWLGKDKEPAGRGKAGKKSKPVPEPETDVMVPCPEADGEMRTPNYCNSEGEFAGGKGCQCREGCPSWPVA